MDPQLCQAAQEALKKCDTPNDSPTCEAAAYKVAECAAHAKVDTSTGNDHLDMRYRSKPGQNLGAAPGANPMFGLAAVGGQERF